MDNFPSVSCLPREESDRESAEILSQVLPVIFERNGFEKLYSDAWWYKLKAGTAVYGVFWNPRKLNGLGDIEIRQIDVLNLFWEPGIKDIQKSKNLFHVELVDREMLKDAYPELTFTGTGNTKIVEFQHSDHIDTSDKCMVVDWYYKVWQNGKQILHYIKYC